jgi:predicted DCC family thiol-disulfide oxidoreductase YuxK
MNLLPPSRKVPPSDPPAFCLLYDADCGFCTRSVRWLVGHLPDLRTLAMQSDEARAWVPDQPADQVALVGPDGAVWLGGAAWTVCLSQIPRLALVARLMAAAPIQPLVHRTYRLIAANRRRISRLWGDTCQLP